MKLKNILKSFYKQLFCFSILFLTIRSQAIIQAYLPEGKTNTVKLARITRQADEMVPIHEANESSIETLEADIATGFAGTWTALETITPEGLTKISEADAVSGVITINSAGDYQLSEDLTSKIIINASNVSLDLNKFFMFQSGSGGNITINSGKDKVVIRNGTMQNSTNTGNGVLIAQDPASNITIENLDIYNYGNGIWLEGTSGNKITNVKISSCKIHNPGFKGILLKYVDGAVVQNCITEKTGEFGIHLDYCQSVYLKDCITREMPYPSGISVTDYYGIGLTNGTYNRVERCLVQEMIANESTLTSLNGIYLSNETKTEVFDCSVQMIEASGNEEAQAFGIRLNTTLLPDDGSLLELLASDDTPLGGIFTNAVYWSPDEKYILALDIATTTKMHIFSFNESTPSLDHICEQNSSGAQAAGWSPDQSTIAVDESGTTLKTYSFSGGSFTQIAAQGEPTDIEFLAWSPDGKYLATTESDGTIQAYAVYNSESYISTPINARAKTGPRGLAWSPDGKYLAVGSDTSPYSLTVYSVNNGFLTAVDSDSTATSIIRSVAWSPTGAYIATGGNDWSFRVFSFDDSTGTLTHIAQTAPGSAFKRSVSWSPDGKYVAGIDNVGVLRILEFNPATPSISTIKQVATGASNAGAVAWSPSGRYIAVGTDDSNFEVQVYAAMSGCESCCVTNNIISNVVSTSLSYGIGIGPVGGSNNLFANNICMGCESNFPYGIANVYYGSHNITKASDNTSLPLRP